MRNFRLLLPILAAAATFTPPAALAEILTWHQADPTSWTSSVRIEGKGLREARIAGIDEVTERLRQEVRMPSSQPQHEYVQKLMIVEEGFQADARLYRARLRLVSALPDPEFEIEERRSASFETATDEHYRPGWVLVVPMDVDAEGAWSLSPAASNWSSRWQVPFRDGQTQFLPATIDADDRRRAREASDLATLARHLASRYQSEAIMMVARSADHQVQIGHWTAYSGFTATALGAFEPSGSLKDLRSLYLEGFWNGVPRSPASDPDFREDIDAAVAVAQGPIGFREVGRPVESASGMTGHLQFIVSGTAWPQIESRLRQIPGFDVASVDDRGSSVMVRYLAQTSDPIALLQMHGFSWE